MGKRRSIRPDLETSFGVVNELPPGRGSGTISLKKGRVVGIKHGRVVAKKRDGREAVVLERFRKENNVFSRIETFGAGTKVIGWEQDEKCEFCASPSCDGICE